MKTPFRILPYAALAAATILGTQNASADIILYQDNFDGDGIEANAGIGGGLKIAGGLYRDWIESGAPGSGLYFTAGGNGGTNQSLATINSFDLSGGFQLTVSYTMTNSGSGARFTMGLMDSDLNSPYQIGGNCVTSTGTDPRAGLLMSAATALNQYAYGIGFVPYAAGTGLLNGLTFTNGNGTTGVNSLLSDAQTRTSGSHTLVLTMDAASNWSYSIDGAPATTGRIGAGFDFSRRYRFVCYGQVAQATISAVTLTVPDNPNLVAWDTNGTDAGSSAGDTAAGTWGGSTNWNTDHSGGSGGSLGDWVAGNKAVFAAGTHATGSYAVAVDGMRDISGLTFQEGNVTISGGTALRLIANSPVDVLYGSIPDVATLLSDDGTPRSMTKVGVGSLALSNANTYTDITDVKNGTLSVPSLAAAGAGSPIGSYASAGAGGLVLTGGTFQFTGTTASTDRGFTLAKTSTVDVNSANGALTLGACSLGATTLNVTGGAGSRLNLGNTTLTGAATLRPTTAALSLASVDGAFNLTLDGTASGNAITGSLGSGAATLTKSNFGTWTLSGLSSRTGASAVNGGGTLILDYSTVDDSKLADGAALTLGGGNLGSTLTLKGGSHPEIVSATTLGGGGTFVTRDGGDSKLRMNAITRQAGGTIAFADATVADTDTSNTTAGILGGWATLGNDWATSVNSAAADTAITALAAYTGALPESGGAATDNNTLTGSQTQSGAVLANTVRITNSGNSDTLDLGANHLTITYASATSLGGILYAGGGDNHYTITGSGGQILTSTTTGELIMTVNSGALKVNVPIVAAGATAGILTKTGPGKLIASAANTFTGAVNINQGVLNLQNASATGSTGGGIKVQNGAALELQGGLVFAADGISPLSGSGVSNGGALRSVSGDNTYGGAITVGAGGARIHSDSDTLTLSGPINIAPGADVTFGGAGNLRRSAGAILGGGNVIKDGAGTLTLAVKIDSVNFHYNGATIVNGGTLELGATNALPDMTAVSLGAATLDAATTGTETAGSLRLTGAATIRLATGAALVFADSSSISWAGGSLDVTGDFVSGSSIRFGNSASALTPGQLALVSINGAGAGSCTLDKDGFLTMIEILPPFENWAANFQTLAQPYANIDFDGGGLTTGLEWVVGGDPTLASDDAANTPILDNSDASFFKFVFKRRDEAAADPNTKIMVEYGTDLTNWRNTTSHGAIDGVLIDDSVDLGGGFHLVAVSIPKTLAVGGKLFARLGVSGLPGSLLSENFESGNGDFTVVTTGGSAWEYGAPNTPNPGGGAVTGGNSGANCWGTKLNDVYATATQTKLRSPVIDLTGLAAANLSFAQAIDIKQGDTLVVNVIEAATDIVLQSAIHTSTPDANINSTAWETIKVATPITGGRKVRIEWHFTGNGDGFYLGAYIDDVLVTLP